MYGHLRKSKQSLLGGTLYICDVTSMAILGQALHM